MLQSQLFTKTSREASREEKSVNAQLLTRAGFVDKLMAGVYSFLPLGLRTLKKIENIIRQEMNNISGQEILLSVLHPKENWQETDRWKYPEMFKLKNRGGKNLGLGWTHEEIITPLVKKFVQSYKDLPVAVYQIQDKFRDELRAKSGLLRTSEFFMKDLYSFHRDEKDLSDYYEKVKHSYFKIFQRCGIGKETFLTLASGSAFSEYSHEFQTITSNGEDEIYLCEKCRIGVNKEIIKKEKNSCPSCRNKNLKIEKAIEVGNIFKLGDRFSRAFDFRFQDQTQKEKFVLMGCYGIGLGRLMGAVAETYHDKNGILWPAKIAPFDFHLIALGVDARVKKTAQKIYHDLAKEKIEVLYDDREKSAGEKLVDSDLIGIPVRIVISERTLEKNSAEVKKRNEAKTRLVKINQLPNF